MLHECYVADSSESVFSIHDVPRVAACSSLGEWLSLH